MTLDIGAGNNPRGDMNIDVKQTPYVNCRASAEYLPFKDNSFDTVRSYYVIEHCLNPAQMVKEAIRVAQRKVEIVTDDIHFPGYLLYYIIRKGFLVNEPEHLYGWTLYYMRNFLRKMDLPYKYKATGIINYDWGMNCRRWDYRLYNYLIIRTWGIFMKPHIKVEIYKGVE